MDELIWNHISARFEDGMLITPGGMHFSQIHSDNIVKNSRNITGDIIHESIYDGRPDVNSIVHLHTPAAVAVSCLKEGFIPFLK